MNESNLAVIVTINQGAMLLKFSVQNTSLYLLTGFDDQTLPQEVPTS